MEVGGKFISSLCQSRRRSNTFGLVISEGGQGGPTLKTMKNTKYKKNKNTSRPVITDGSQGGPTLKTRRKIQKYILAVLRPGGPTMKNEKKIGSGLSLVGRPAL